jgi:hypothetical protein
MAAILLSASYVAIYLPMPIEARYGTPLFLLLVLFFIGGMVEVRRLVAEARYIPIGLFTVWFVAFMTGCAWLSAWLDRYSVIWFPFL